jgi:hypothetical protein
VKALFSVILRLFGVNDRKVASPVAAKISPLRFDLQFFSEEPGVDFGGIADPETVDNPEPTEPTIDPQPPAEPQPTDPPTDGIEQSKAFAKRLEERTQAKLAEERAKWEQETSERYGNYDQYQQTLDYVMKASGYNSFEEFQTALEEAQLAERAEQNGVSTEYQQRLEQLEQRASRADELEQQHEQEQIMQQFHSALSEFSKEKGVDPNDLEQFMVENQIPNFEMAYRALRYEQMESDLKNAKDVAVKEYLESKKAPKVEGGGTPGIVKDTPPKNFAEARQRALARLNEADTQD